MLKRTSCIKFVAVKVRRKSLDFCEKYFRSSGSIILTFCLLPATNLNQFRRFLFFFYLLLNMRECRSSDLSRKLPKCPSRLYSSCKALNVVTFLKSRYSTRRRVLREGQARLKWSRSSQLKTRRSHKKRGLSTQRNRTPIKTCKITWIQSFCMSFRDGAL